MKSPFLGFKKRLKYRRAPHGARGLKSPASRVAVRPDRSRPTRGAWIEITASCRRWKSCWSRPTRGAWIEMCIRPTLSPSILGRAPHGARGLKSACPYDRKDTARRAPHGARGLKSLEHDATQPLPRSEPRPKADAPDCKCSPGRPISKEGMLCRKGEIGSARPPSRNGGEVP